MGSLVKEFLSRQKEASALIPVAALQEDVPPRLTEIAKELALISGEWNMVELYTVPARQLTRAQERFFTSLATERTYNPSFDYPQAAGLDLQEARQRLEALKEAVSTIPRSTFGSEWLAAALQEKILDDLTTCDLVDGLAGRSIEGLQGDELVKQAFARKYWPPDEALLHYAENLFDQATRGQLPVPSTQEAQLTSEQQQQLQAHECTAGDIQQAFTWALQRYGLLREGAGSDGFQVVLTSEATSIDVRHRSTQGPTVFIPESMPEPRRGHELLTLLRHEIEGHARQVENGRRLFGICGGQLTCDDETLYEGLAVHQEMEYLAARFGPAAAVREMGYVYPTALALAQQGGSFGDIFKDQRERFLRVTLKVPRESDLPPQAAIAPELWKQAQQRAWKITYRVMRGHHDTANLNAYGMWKDLAYTRGLLIQKELNRSRIGHFNEAGVFTRLRFLSLATIDLRPEDLPLPDRSIAADFEQQLLNKAS